MTNNNEGASEMSNAKTVTVDVPLTWWATFTDEPIVRYLDEVADPDIAELVAVEPVKVTKTVRRLVLTDEQLATLLRQADWYAYYWTEVADPYDSGERLAWSARSRGSAALARRIKKLMPVTEVAG